MKEINDKELHNVTGGSAWGIIAGIGAAITFIIGFFDGYVHPKACN